MEAYHSANYFIGSYLSEHWFRMTLFVFAVLACSIIGFVLSMKNKNPNERSAGIVASVVLLGVSAHGIWYWKQTNKTVKFTIINTTMYSLSGVTSWKHSPLERDSAGLRRDLFLSPGSVQLVELPTRAYKLTSPLVNFESRDEALMLWMNSFSNELAGFGIATHPEDSLIYVPDQNVLRNASYVSQYIAEPSADDCVIVTAESPLPILNSEINSKSDAVFLANVARSLSASARRQREYEETWGRRELFPFDLGIDLEDHNSDFGPGVTVNSVSALLPEGMSNPLQRGDVILQINGSDVYAVADVAMSLYQHANSKYYGVTVPIKMKIARNGSVAYVTTTYWFNKQYFRSAEGLETNDTEAMLLGAYNNITLGHGEKARSVAENVFKALRNTVEKISSVITEDEPKYVPLHSVSDREWELLQSTAMYRQWHSDAYNSGVRFSNTFDLRKRIMKRTAGKGHRKNFVVSVVDRALERFQKEDFYDSALFGTQFSGVIWDGQAQAQSQKETVNVVELELQQSEFYQIYVHNDSPDPIDLSVAFRGTDSRLQTYHYSDIEPEKDVYLSSSGHRVLASGNDILWWAETSSEANKKYYWHGDYHHISGGKLYYARRKSIGEEDIRLNLTVN